MSELGRLAYEAYSRCFGDAFTTLGPAPLWPELPEASRKAWDAAADAAVAGPDPVHEPEHGGF